MTTSTTSNSNPLDLFIPEKWSQKIDDVKMLKIPVNETGANKPIYGCKIKAGEPAQFFVKFAKTFSRGPFARTSMWSVKNIETSEIAYLAKTKTADTSQWDESLWQKMANIQMRRKITYLGTHANTRGEHFDYRLITQGTSFDCIRLFNMLAPIKETVDLIATQKDTWIADFESKPETVHKIAKSATGGKFAVFLVKKSDGSNIKIYIKLFFIDKGSSKKIYKALDYSDDLKVVAISKTSLVTTREHNSYEIRRTCINEAKFLQMFPGSKHILQTSYLGIRTSPKGIQKQYFFLPFCAGGTLTDSIMSLRHKQRMLISQELAAAFTEFHSENGCHQDCKTDNILLTEDLHPILIDFGYSRHITENLGFMGSLTWMSPEKLRAKTSIPSELAQPIDIWALGAVFYSMFIEQDSYLRTADAVPFSLDNIAYAFQSKHNNEAPTAQNPMETLIYQMMDNDPKKRPTAEQILIKIKEITAAEAL